MSIPVFKPTIRRKDMQTVLTVMVADTLGPDTMVREFALGLAKYLGLTHAWAFRSYSAALDIALEALGLPQGAKIAMSPLSPSLYVKAMAKAGFIPVFIDVEADSPVVALSSLEAALKEEPSAILLHHHLGFIQPVEEIKALTQLPIIEDISQCLGAKSGDRMTGAAGNFTILSTESDGLITTGGGAVLACGGKKEQAPLKDLIRQKPQDWIMGDMNASLGKTQLEALETFLAQRGEIAQAFSKAVLQSRHKNIAQKDEGSNVHYTFPVLLSSGMKDVQQYAAKKKIETKPAFEDSVFAAMEAGREDLKSAAGFMLRCLCFPLYPTLGKKNIEQIARVLSSLP